MKERERENYFERSHFTCASQIGITSSSNPFVFPLNLSPSFLVKPPWFSGLDIAMAIPGSPPHPAADLPANH